MRYAELEMINMLFVADLLDCEFLVNTFYVVGYFVFVLNLSNESILWPQVKCVCTKIHSKTFLFHIHVRIGEK